MKPSSHSSQLRALAYGHLAATREPDATWRESVKFSMVVEVVNLHGDGRADRQFLGGPDNSVYANAAEDWSVELD